MMYINAKLIDNYPKLHSTAMEIKRLLVIVDTAPYEEAVFGWYLPSTSIWRIQGSPSNHEIAYFAPIPSLNSNDIPLIFNYKLLAAAATTSEMQTLASEVFSSKDIAAEWMNEDNAYLDGRSPLQVIASESKNLIKMAFDRLNRIKYGVIG